jgi:ABC-2 type transport system ATP-binding protein
MTTPIIEIRNLTKDYKTDFWKPRTRALQDVSFQVEEGSVFGLIGPNGAGKTTTIKILMGLIHPTEGEVRILGEGEKAIRTKRFIGYLPEAGYYYDYLKTEEVLDFYGRLFGYGLEERRRKVDELLDLVGLSHRRGVRLRHYSKGMLQRIGIAQAMINDPKVVILDEPMSGLDPVGRKDVRDIILRLRERGKTILFSSHVLPDIEALCDHVAILVGGRLRSTGSLAELIHPRIKNTELIFRGDPEGGIPEGWRDFVSLRKVGRDLVVSLTEVSKLGDLLEWGRGKGLELVSVIPQKETLEDIFVGALEGER